MRNPSASLGLLAVALLLTACGSTPTSGGNKQYKIGFVYPTLNNPFFVDQESGANAAANEFGAKVIHVDGQNKVDVQTTLVENFIAQKVDALIVQPVDTAGIVAAINESTTAKVPVFTTGEEPNGGTVVTKVVFDETQNGITAGTFLGQHLKAGAKVVELQGILGTETARNRSTGFEKGLAQACSGCTIVAKQPADFDRSKGLTVMENILHAQPKIDGVYAANDEMAMGAIKAIQEAGRQSQITLVSNDGIADAIAAVKQGQMAATVAIPAYIQGFIAVESAVKHLQGKSVCAKVTEKATLLTADNVAKADSLMKAVSAADRYWESSCYK